MCIRDRGYCNSSVNVFIYGRKNSVLRRAVGNFVRNLFNCRQKDDNAADFADSIRQRRDSMTVHHQATLPIRIRFDGDDSPINPTIEEEEEEEESINNNKPKTAESFVVAVGTLSSNDADSSL